MSLHVSKKKLHVAVVCECLYLHVDIVVYATYFCPMLALKSWYAYVCVSMDVCLLCRWLACIPA